MKYADLDEQYARFPSIDRAEVQKFMDWTKAQPHMPNLSEPEALLFFHACGNSMELAKQVLDTNLTVRTHCKEFFGQLDCERPEVQRAMKTIAMFPLSQRTPAGNRVLISRLADTNAANFNFADALKLYFMVFDVCLFEDGIRAGDIIVMDLQGVSLGHVARLGLMQMKKFLYFLQEAASIRIAGMHFVNIVPFMDKILALMHPFMKKELRSMLFLHNELADFHKHVPQSILPKEYGGPLAPGDELKEIYYNKLREYRQDMLDFEQRYQVNEQLRPGKPKNASDIFGIEGNFKKLDID